jgi:hypothetical protein
MVPHSEEATMRRYIALLAICALFPLTITSGTVATPEGATQMNQPTQESDGRHDFDFLFAEATNRVDAAGT